MCRYAFLIFLLLLMIAAVQPETNTAVDWLLNQQTENGGWSDGLSEHSGPGITVDAVLALWASGVVLSEFDPNPIAYLESYANQNVTTLTPALAARFAFVAVIADAEVENFGGVSLREVIFGESDEAFSGGVSLYEHCLMMTAAYAIDSSPPESVINYVIENANQDGGWGFAPGEVSDTVTTSMCMQALIAAEYSGEMLTSALDYFRAVQNPDGGWIFRKPTDFSTETDAYATASVIMALDAAGENLDDWNRPQDTLRGLQTDSGAFVSPQQNQLMATAQAVFALEGMNLLDVGK